MRSINVRILVWCFVTLAVSLIAFSTVTRFVQARAAGNGGPLARVDAMILREAVTAYEGGGSARLAEYLQKTNRYLGDPRYVTDPAGRDLATGVDRSDLLGLVHSQWATPLRNNGHMIVALASPDDRYRLITVLEPPFSPGTLLPYYALIFLAVAVVCWALAVSIASPLRALARSVERFGRGELELRLNSRRRDEIGDLSRSFDGMAERIGTLLAAERRLLQDVSHELRSPLARMSFAVELAQRSDRRDAALAKIRDEIERLSGLVGSLLQVTRSEGDPGAKEREEFSITALLDEIAAGCWIEAEARGCRIVIDAGEDAVIQGDREQLRRAFENIVRNAIRYAPSGTRVEVSVECADQLARVRIRDSGAGVPDEFLDQMGKPFARADDSRDSATGGVGLGLAIAKRAVTLHHGLLRFENARPGLRATVELPLIGMTAPAAADKDPLVKKS